MGGIVVAILAFFVILYYWSGKNDDIWEDETFKRLFPKSEKINIQIIYIMALIMFGCSMILEVKYNGKIPTVFIAMVLEDWILVLILIWNHRDNKQNIKYALIYGIISTIIFSGKVLHVIIVIILLKIIETEPIIPAPDNTHVSVAATSQSVNSSISSYFFLQKIPILIPMQLIINKIIPEISHIVAIENL